MKHCTAEDCRNKVHAKGLCSRHYRWQRAATVGRLCAKSSCDKRPFADGLCRPHYDRRRRTETRKDGSKPPCAVDGCSRIEWARGLCSLHLARLHRTGDPGPAHVLRAPNGSGHLARDGYRHVYIDGGYIPEHRHVLAQHLGRPLTEHESVHHKNGSRADNRLSNLELWSRYQPAGQRVADKLAWAHEIIALYGDLSPAAP